MGKGRPPSRPKPRGAAEAPAPASPALPAAGVPGGSPEERVGVLLANLGTPDGHGYWPMRRYLAEFLSDRRVIDYSPWVWQPLLQLVILSRRPFTSGANYRKIWNHDRGESPLLTITRAQTAKLAALLGDRYGDRVRVDFCMRYGNPSTAGRLAAMAAAGCRRILFLPLYPQYAGATTATACDHLFRALMAMRWQPAVRTVAPYFDDPAYIDALAQSVERAYGGLDQRPDILVATYHGLPRRYVTAGDPYLEQCLATSRLLARRLGWPEEAILPAFQSRFGPEEWLRPYTVDAVADLARRGRRRIAVIAPAFAADCIETLEEIRGEIRESFEHAGGESFTYIPCLNDADAHIAALAGIAAKNLAGWLA